MKRQFVMAFCAGMFALLTAFSVQAQKATVSGVVSDEFGELYGATVFIKGTTNGTTTDFSGIYKLENVEPGEQVVVFSFVGMKTIEVPVSLSAGQGLTLNQTMEEDRVLLDDVVVIGYGTINKEDAVGSIAVVGAEAIEESPTSDFAGTLQGRAPGVQVTAGSGMAGSAPSVRIRGISSIGAGGQPLYVVDGVIINSDGIGSPGLGSTTNPLSDINPEDIESISILKDADAAAIYGSRGSNGVILITTKRGTSGKTKITASYSNGIGTLANREEYLNGQEGLALRDTLAALGLWDADAANDDLRDGVERAEADSFVAVNPDGTDWVDVVTQMSSLETASVSASGGNEKTQFYLAGNYRDERGFILNNRFQRASGRMNLDHQATDKLKVGVNLNLLHTVNDRVRSAGSGGFGWATELHNYLPVYQPDQETYAMTWTPLYHLNRHSFNVKSYRTISNLYAEYEIIPGLKLRSSFGADLLNQVEDFVELYNDQVGLASWNQSHISDKRTNVINWTQTNYLTYDDTLFNAKNAINVVAGNEVNEQNTSGLWTTGHNFANESIRSATMGVDSLQDFGSWRSKFGFVSYFARAQYKYDGKYILKASVRADGSSKFGKNHRYGYFPAGGFSWLIHKESFMDSVEIVSNLKLRANYGLTGNSNIPDQQFAGYWDAWQNGYQNTNVISPSNLANEDLRWEKGQQVDVGIEVGLWENRLAISTGAYYKRSKDLLLRMSLPVSAGYNSSLQNLGAIENKGIELDIASTNIENIDKDFTWTTNFNISVNRNKVLDVAGLPPDAFDVRTGEARVIVDQPVGVHYVVHYAGVAQETADYTIYDDEMNEVATGTYEPGQDLYYDIYGNVVGWHNDLITYHRQPTGSPLPTFNGGITNTFEYKNFELTFMWSYVYGNSIYLDEAKNRLGGNIDRNNSWRMILDYWTEDNTDTDIPALEHSLQAGSRNSDRFLYDGSYLRLRQAGLTYTLPVKWAEAIKLYNAKVYVRGGNLLTFTNYPGWDPEVIRDDVDPNSDAGNIAFASPYFSTPQPRTLIFGAKIQF